MIYQVDSTRETIRLVARKLFVENGLFETEMGDVASAASVSRGTVYRYYRDKSDLALAVLEIVRDELNDLADSAVLLDKHTPAIDRAERYLRDVWLNPEHTDVYRFLAEFDAFHSGRRITETVLAGIRDLFRRDSDPVLTEILEQGQLDGTIDESIDRHLAMVTIVNAVRGLQQRLILRGRALIEIRTDELGRMMDELVRYCICGIAAGRAETDNGGGR
jgi:AcrR family transcriptional regulator